MHEEHIWNNAVKQGLKHQYADIIEEKSNLGSAAATVASAFEGPHWTNFHKQICPDVLHLVWNAFVFGSSVP